MGRETERGEREKGKEREGERRTERERGREEKREGKRGRERERERERGFLTNKRIIFADLKWHQGSQLKQEMT